MTRASERAVDAVRELILRGDGAAGGRLGEAELAERLGVSRTPVREALNRLAAEGLVEIVYELHADRLVVEVSDHGEGFEPPAQPASALTEEDLSEGGLGIAIIEALADEFEVGEREDGGSRLRFVKRLP